jgi:uncharacterized membrane protein SpoIIM required for sporulation
MEQQNDCKKRFYELTVAWPWASITFFILAGVVGVFILANPDWFGFDERKDGESKHQGTSWRLTRGAVSLIISSCAVGVTMSAQQIFYNRPR